MLDLAGTIVARAARVLFADHDESALWSISVGPRVVGALRREEGVYRLVWFNGADPRLAALSGPVDQDVDGLAAALGARIGQPVHLELLTT